MLTQLALCSVEKQTEINLPPQRQGNNIHSSPLIRSKNNVMETKPHKSLLCVPLRFLFLCFFHHSRCQVLLPTTSGFTCSSNQTPYPCQTYAFYGAKAPELLDLGSIGDLFSLSRLMIAKPSNISSPASPLLPDQPLFIPLACSCNSLNSTYSISYANLTYTIKKGDSFYFVSTEYFQNLTTYQSVEVVNPTLIPERLEIGTNVVFPVFCKCPGRSQVQNGTRHLVSYVFQPSDSLSTVASRFGVETQSITAINGNRVRPLETIFIPVDRLPVLSQPAVTPSEPQERADRKGVVTGLAIGLGLCGLLLMLLVGASVYGGVVWWRKEKEMEEEKQKMRLHTGAVGPKVREMNLIAHVSDCLDRYRVFKIEELREATDDFSDGYLIQGSVYKGCIHGEEVYAIKKMDWNAIEELKILQKVNHGNLVKLEGFCIDPEEANCYLIYEFIENGSLYSWLHRNKAKKLTWKTRLRIAIDIANGLQYIHEHTRPRVVHKDIKSSNILLDSNMRAKIANFGLAKSGCNAMTVHIVGTQGYIAPEYLADGVVSTRMDVFSFGVVLLELVSGREAIGEGGKFLWQSVEGIMDGNEEMKEKRVRDWMDGVLLEDSCSMESVMSMMSVAVACFHRDPSRRPSMVDIVYALCKTDDFIFDLSEENLSAPQVLAR